MEPSDQSFTSAPCLTISSILLGDFVLRMRDTITRIVEDWRAGPRQRSSGSGGVDNEAPWSEWENQQDALLEHEDSFTKATKPRRGGRKSEDASWDDVREEMKAGRPPISGGKKIPRGRGDLHSCSDGEEASHNEPQPAEPAAGAVKQSPGTKLLSMGEQMVDALKDSASLKASRLRLEGETTKEELAQKRLKLEHDIAMDKQNALDKESEAKRADAKAAREAGFHMLQMQMLRDMMANNKK